MHGPEYGQIKLHSGANYLRCRKAPLNRYHHHHHHLLAAGYSNEEAKNVLHKLQYGVAHWASVSKATGKKRWEFSSEEYFPIFLVAAVSAALADDDGSGDLFYAASEHEDH